MIRIVLACFCGAVIGMERNKRKKEAGLRTHIIVALGSVLVMVVSKYGFLDMIALGGNLKVDPTRIASNVIAGISFLGAGTIVFREHTIKGLTTAAGIWATSGVGLAMGAGMYEVGVFSTAAIIAIQYVLHRYVRSEDSAMTSELSVILVEGPNTIEEFMAQLAEKGIVISSGGIHKHGDGTITLELSIYSTHGLTFEETLDLCKRNENIKAISG
ncbi:MAG: MgtC/SapB family protein [Candidatus Pelethousia sp.]|nr:MgtC/SapB family protein [Candidatus Pelethousia sp.]